LAYEASEWSDLFVAAAGASAALAGLIFVGLGGAAAADRWRPC
jgi:hypothetical protein